MPRAVASRKAKNTERQFMLYRERKCVRKWRGTSARAFGRKEGRAGPVDELLLGGEQVEGVDERAGVAARGEGGREERDELGKGCLVDALGHREPPERARPDRAAREEQGAGKRERRGAPGPPLHHLSLRVRACAFERAAAALAVAEECECESTMRRNSSANSNLWEND